MCKCLVHGYIVLTKIILKFHSPTILSSIQLAKLYKDAPSHAYKISKTALNMLTALYAQDFPGLIFIAANPGVIKQFYFSGLPFTKLTCEVAENRARWGFNGRFAC